MGYTLCLSALVRLYRAGIDHNHTYQTDHRCVPLNASLQSIVTYPPGLVEHDVDAPMLDIFFGAACSVPSPKGRLVDTSWKLNTLRPRQNDRHFTVDIFKYI